MQKDVGRKETQRIEFIVRHVFIDVSEDNRNNRAGVDI
jgi:hypothetical protein